MDLFNFFRRFPNEQLCRDHFKRKREKQGVICKKCGNDRHYWLSGKEQFQCVECRFRTTLRSGTIMQGSNLPFQYWYMAMHLMSSTKKPLSALEMQRQLGHNRYEPIWYMMHKIRAAMGKRDKRYNLTDYVEMDEGFFESVNEQPEDPLTGEKEPLKRGRGSQQKSGVLVMASTKFDHKHTRKRKKHRPNSSFRYVKMIVMDDFKGKSVNRETAENVDPEAIAITDGNRSYSKLKNILQHHLAEKVPSKLAGKKLPWVHIMISNAKRNIDGIFHMVKEEYLQNYLNEFCYKTNRRYFGKKLFDRLLLAGVSATWF